MEILKNFSLSKNKSVQISVEIYKIDDSRYGVYLSHDGSSGVGYLGMETAKDIASCIETYIDLYA